MYCNHCGTQLPAGAKYCPNCQGAVTAIPRRKVENHLTLLSALWFAMGALRMLAAAAVFVFGTVFLPMIIRQQSEPIPFPIHGLMAGIGIMVGITAVLTLAVGWGLYKREPWGRTLAIVMAFLSLLSIPFGTALGIYTLFVLLPREAGDEWQTLAKNY